MQQPRANGSPHTVDWNEIDDVLLDMDGTLLDRHFDNFFFEEELPRRYAVKHALGFEEARDRLLSMYRSVEGELAWTDLHYWTRRVDIDVVALHWELDHMIGFLPDAEAFLMSLRRLGSASLSSPMPIAPGWRSRPPRQGWIGMWTALSMRSRSGGSRCEKNIGPPAGAWSVSTRRAPSTSMTTNNVWRPRHGSASVASFIAPSRVPKPTRCRPTGSPRSTPSA